jgi:hypothetical protein
MCRASVATAWVTRSGNRSGPPTFRFLASLTTIWSI